MFSHWDLLYCSLLNEKIIKEFDVKNLCLVSSVFCLKLWHINLAFFWKAFWQELSMTWNLPSCFIILWAFFYSSKVNYACHYTLLSSVLLVPCNLTSRLYHPIVSPSSAYSTDLNSIFSLNVFYLNEEVVFYILDNYYGERHNCLYVNSLLLVSPVCSSDLLISSFTDKHPV